MKQNLNILLVACFLVFGFNSCGDDFLNQAPRGSLTAGSFPVSASDAELATNSIYNSLRAWHINTGGFPILDMMSDEATKGSNPGDGAAISVYDNFSHTSIEGSVERYYKTMYEAIRRSNLVINLVPEIEMEQDRKDYLIAQARFLRGYFYSHMLRIFGDLPLVTEIDPPLDLARTDASIIFQDVVIPDLQYAIAILPERSEQDLDDLGRATKGSARALLARLHMYYNNYTMAGELLQDVIDSKEYMLQDSFAGIFPETFEHNAESIFEITAAPRGFVDGGNQYANTQAIRGTPNRGWGFARPAYTWINMMQDSEDPRLDPSVIFLGEVLGGVETVGDSSTPDTILENGQIVEIECYNQKVWHSGTDTESAWGHNRRIIRYADVMLMLAEVKARNNETGDALILLNTIRRRAAGGDPTILPDITNTNQDELIDIILEERHREFAFEGLRFWDLVRTNKAEEVLGPLGFLPNKNEFLPIPQSEVDISQGRIVQNIGY